MSLPPIRHLEAFMAVAQARSFRVASERMGLSQPALSQNIALLESSLGVTLFTRSTRSVRLGRWCWIAGAACTFVASAARCN